MDASKILPLELWKKILATYETDADPAEFAKLKEVCTSWYHMIQQIPVRRDKWYLTCKEMVPEVLWPIMQKHHFFRNFDFRNVHQSKEQPGVFKALHNSWFQLRNIDVNHMLVDRLRSPKTTNVNTHITSFAALGMYVIVGNSEGYTAIYDLQAMRKIALLHYPCMVEVIKFLRYDDELLLVMMLLKGNYRPIFWDIKACQELRYSCDFNLESEETNVFNITYRMLDMKNGRMLTLTPRNILEDSPDCWRREGDQHQRRIRHRPNVVPMRRVWEQVGRHIQISAEEIQANRGCPYLNSWCFHINRFERKSIYYRLGLSGYHDYYTIGIKVGNKPFTPLNTRRCFGSPVTTMMFHVRILIVGLASGQIRIYPVKKIEDVASESFYKQPFTEIDLQAGFISNLTMTECSGIPHLVVVTQQEAIHVIRFTKCYQGAELVRGEILPLPEIRLPLAQNDDLPLEGRLVRFNFPRQIRLTEFRVPRQARQAEHDPPRHRDNSGNRP